MDDLQASIDELYLTFAHYQMGDDFSGCDHCVDPTATKYLAATPLTKLSLDDLNVYAFKALSTWGELTHFKHFLPRLLELAAADPNGFTSLEVLFGKLKYDPTPWTYWPNAERSAIERFFHVLWLHVLRNEGEGPYRDVDTVDTLLRALGRANTSVATYLATWLATRGQAAVRQLARFVLVNADYVLAKRQLFNSYWDNPSAVREVLDWLASSVVAEYLGSERSALSGDLVLAISQLDAIQAMDAETT
jgi:hypothetical protein